MGEVYLAEDTRLGRKVALKVLPENLRADEQAKRRFTQEARTASALNHPHIITIYDIVADGNRDFIVMEYVEGETLRTLLERGKVEIKRALEIAAQTASGLAAAHDAGIVHRDIKPENIIIAPLSQAKILDFGIAKLTEKQRVPLAGNEETTAALAATVKNETAPGTVLGTMAYMSPEQAQGRALDQRTDIFSLGVTLYEMLAGRRPFAGQSAIDTLHAIINQEPPSIAELNSRVPAEATDVLGKALAKDVAERYRHAGDFELDLRRLKRAIETNSLLSARTQTLPKSPERRTSKSALVALTAASALVIAVVAFAAWRFGRSSVSVPRTASMANVKLTPLTTDAGYEGEPTFSPDGETIAYVSDRTGNFEIYLKQVSGGPDINLTNNPADDVQPAFSPDDKQIAFVSTRASKSDLIYRSPNTPLMGGDIWVMPALGGSPRRIVEEGNFPSWSPDGKTILYTAGQWGDHRIFSVPASGGAAREIPLKFKAGEPPLFLFYPSYSSDGRWILFVAQNEIYVVDADGGEPQQIARGQRPAWSADSDAVIFSNAEPGKNFSLWRVPFSTAEGKTNGAPEPLTVGRGRDTQAAVSRNGKLIAFATHDISFNIESVSFDAEAGRMAGAPQALTGGDNRYYFFDVSPDGRSIVAESHRGASYSIWRIDAGAPPAQLISDRNFEDRSPKWSPDGSRIAFIRSGIQPQSKNSMWIMAADGANPQLLFETTGDFRWTPDGRALIYYSPVERQIYAFDLASQDKRQITDEQGVMQKFNISYDGKWLIYQSTMESGIPHIRAIPVEGGAARTVVVAPGENYHPFLSPSGKWLYFQHNHKNLYRVPGPTQDWRPVAPEKATDYPESNLFLEDPQISRDGRQLLYSRGRITSDIWIMELAT